MTETQMTESQMTESEMNARANNLAPPYQPTLSEQEVLASHLARKQAAAPSPRMRLERRDGVSTIGVEHPEPGVAQVLLMEAIGTLNRDFLEGLLSQLANAGGGSGDGLNFMLAMVKGIKPRDQIECMLAAQMAAVHVAAMAFARRSTQAERAVQDGAAGSFNKLARTFAAQIEALKRYRCGGEQRVLVERVTVNDGGQAIVGQVGMGGGENPRTTPGTGTPIWRGEAGAHPGDENARTTP